MHVLTSPRTNPEELAVTFETPEKRALKERWNEVNLMAIVGDGRRKLSLRWTGLEIREEKKTKRNEHVED